MSLDDKGEKLKSQILFCCLFYYDLRLNWELALWDNYPKSYIQIKVQSKENQRAYDTKAASKRAAGPFSRQLTPA